MTVRIRAGTRDDLPWIREALIAAWGGPDIVSRDMVHQADELPALVAERGGERAGLLTYRISDGECEVVTLQAFERRAGVGTALLRAATELAKEQRCRRLWLVTTNDNVGAIRFYERAGMRLRAVHRGAMTRARRIKPEIPLLGESGIPIEDEHEFELVLESG